VPLRVAEHREDRIRGGLDRPLDLQPLSRHLLIVSRSVRSALGG
jgi:hypothetical protein